MNIRLTPIAAAIASLLACSLLAACGGGGGGGMVRANPPPVTPPPASPPPPPDPVSAGPCPMPISADCAVTSGGVMLDGRSSQFSLLLRIPAGQSLKFGSNSGPYAEAGRQGVYSFAGGTLIESGTLVVTYPLAPNTLVSNVVIRPEGRLSVHGGVVGNIGNQGALDVWGTVSGEVENAGLMHLIGTVRGNVVNRGSIHVTGVGYGAGMGILGDFTQSSEGSLAFAFAPPGFFDSPVPLYVSGRALLDGTLQLEQYNDGWDMYPLPVTGEQHILYADGGVFGQFARWTSPGLFIEGSLRYGSKDVWFDLTRVSVQAAMASNGVSSALTLASANNLDRLFLRTDGLAQMAPGVLSDAQRRLLTSAGAVLRIDDITQATRTLDSLSGAVHADAMQASLQQGTGDAATDQRLAVMQPGAVAGTWSNMSAAGRSSGFDQWLSSRLLVGVHAGQTADARRDTFGQAGRLSPQAGAYLRWFGDDGWHAGGSAGYAQHNFALDRTIDLGRGGQWNAHSRHRFNVAGVHGKAGRRVAFAGGTLTPYVALDATAQRSERTIEQGGTGFELALQPTMQAQLGAGLGLRYGREWQLGETGWLRLDADARVQRQLAAAGNPLRASFVGVPDLWFDLPSHSNRTSGRLDLGLRGGFGQDWSWMLQGMRSDDRRSVHAWQLRLSRDF